MCDYRALAQNSVSAQADLFRIAERDHGKSIKVLHAETKIPKPTLRSWAKGTTMPAWALFALGKAGIPDHLLSLVGDPFQRFVGTDEDGEAPFHEAALEAGGFQQEYLTATSPDSEGGPAITPREAARLRERGARAGAKLRAVA